MRIIEGSFWSLKYKGKKRNEITGISVLPFGRQGEKNSSVIASASEVVVRFASAGSLFVCILGVLRWLFTCDETLLLVALPLGLLLCALIAVCSCRGRASRVCLPVLAATLLLALLFWPRLADGLSLFFNDAAQAFTRSSGRLYLPLTVTAAPGDMVFCRLLAAAVIAVPLAVLASWVAVRCRLQTVCLVTLGFLAGVILLHPAPNGWLLALAVSLLLLLAAQVAGNGRAVLGVLLPSLVLAVLIGGAAFAVLSQSLLQNASQSLSEMVHQLRYEPDGRALPEGNFSVTPPGGDGTLLTVTLEKKEAVYLRGFVGDVFDEEGWRPLSGETLAEYSSLLYWLHQEGFYPQTQFAQVAALLAQETGTALETNALQVENTAACSRYLYTPYGLLAGENSLLPAERELQSSTLLAGGWHGQRSYAYENVYAAASLFVDALGLLEESDAPQVLQYRINEKNYRQFVYENDLALPQFALDWLAPLQDPYCQEYGGREGLSKEAAADCLRLFMDNDLEQALKQKAEEDSPMTVLLSRVGLSQDVKYATLVTLALRYYGVPARYAEGYLLSLETAQQFGDGAAIPLGADDAHAWVEVYQDGLGWLPMEVTPGYSAITSGVMEYGGLSDGDSGSQENGHAGLEDTQGTPLDSETEAQDQEEQENQEQEEQEEGEQPEPTFWERGTPLTHLLLLAGLPLLLLLLAAVFLVLRRRRRLNAREKLLLAAAPRDAVCWCFSYTMLLLADLGLARGNNSPLSLCQAVEQHWDAALAERYRQAALWNRETMFSRHAVSEEARQHCRDFQLDVLSLLKQESKWFRRCWLKWIKCHF